MCAKKLSAAECIATRTGLKLWVEKRAAAEEVEVRLHTPLKNSCLLHWGLRQAGQPSWQIPPQSSWPTGSHSYGSNAVQTPFARHNDESLVGIHLGLQPCYSAIEFALFFPDEGRWDNND